MCESTFWTGCTDIGWVCKVFGEVLRGEMELRLELYGEIEVISVVDIGQIGQIWLTRFL